MGQPPFARRPPASHLARCGYAGRRARANAGMGWHRRGVSFAVSRTGDFLRNENFVRAGGSGAADLVPGASRGERQMKGDSGLVIRTPEGIEFSLPLAGPVSR